VKVKAFREQHGLSQKAMAGLLGSKHGNLVGERERKDEDIPDHWIPKLEAKGYRVSGGGGRARPTTPGATGVPTTPVDDEAGSTSYRDHDVPPTPPQDAPQAPPDLAQINYGQVAGYIEGAYVLAAKMLVEPADRVAAECITVHAGQAGVAWAKWIESEPKVAALLQRMMIGTPIGEVIGVHVAIVFAYVLARRASDQLASDTVGNGSGQAPQHGAPGEAAEDFVA